MEGGKKGKPPPSPQRKSGTTTSVCISLTPWAGPYGRCCPSFGPPSGWRLQLEPFTEKHKEKPDIHSEMRWKQHHPRRETKAPPPQGGAEQAAPQSSPLGWCCFLPSSIWWVMFCLFLLVPGGGRNISTQRGRDHFHSTSLTTCLSLHLFFAPVYKGWRRRGREN